MSILSRTSKKDRAIRAARKKAVKGAAKGTKVAYRGARSAREKPRLSAGSVLGVLGALSAVIFLRRRSAKTEVTPSYSPPVSASPTPDPGLQVSNGTAAPLTAVHSDEGDRTPPHGDPSDS